MPCEKCEALIKDLIRLTEKYRYSYFVNGMKEALEVVEEGSIEGIKLRDKDIISRGGSAKARAKVRRRKI